MKKLNLLPSFLLCASVAWGQVSPKLQAKITQQAKEIEPKIIEWRRQFHQYPELSNQEFKTGAKPASIMHQLSKGYTDEQLALIAGWFSEQKAPK